MQTQMMDIHPSDRRISLASGVLPEFDAITVSLAAVAAGFTDAGLMVRPDEWDTTVESQLLAIKEEHGIGFLDVEVLWVPQGGELDDNHKLIVDVGGRLGAEHVLVVSDEADPERLAPALGQISGWCEPYALRPVLEFLRITAVTSLAQAQELLAASHEHDFGILLDSLHLARSDELSALPILDPAQFPYVQLCDGALTCADDRPSLLRDALDLRLAPGEGELPLHNLLSALPKEVPLSMEVRSKVYRDAYPDPTERALAVLAKTCLYLTGENL